MDGRWIFDSYKKKKVSGKVKVNQNGLFQNFFPPLSLPLFLLLFHSLSALWCSIFVKREKGRCRFIRFRTNLKNAKAFLKFVFPSFVSLLLWCATNSTLLIFSYNFSFLFFLDTSRLHFRFHFQPFLLSGIRGAEDLVFEANRSPFPREMDGVYVQLFNAILQ